MSVKVWRIPIVCNIPRIVFVESDTLTSAIEIAREGGGNVYKEEPAYFEFDDDYDRRYCWQIDPTAGDDTRHPDAIKHTAETNIEKYTRYLRDRERDLERVNSQIELGKKEIAEAKAILSELAQQQSKGQEDAN